MALALVAAPLVTSSPAHADPLVSIRHLAGVDALDGFSFWEATPSGRFAAVFKTQVEPFRLDVATGATTPIRFRVPLGAEFQYQEVTLADDGVYAYGLRTEVTGTYLRRVTVDTGSIDLFTVPLPAGWVSRGVVDTDAAGRLMLIDAVRFNASGAASFLFDTATQQLAAPGPIGGTRNTRGLAVSPDGREVSYSEIVIDGIDLRTVILDRVTAATTVIERPVGATSDHWELSPDHRWMLFVGEAAGIVPGLDGSRRLYRRDLRTGATDVPPIPAPAPPGDYRIYNGGRVLAVDGGQMSVWDGHGAATLVSRGYDGNPASGAVGGFGRPVQANEDGTSIVFSSRSTNLVPLPFSAFPRLYQATLAAVPGLPNSWAIVQANERYCVAAVGAEPGDFVGVNITPVLATTPGFGTLHSSDDPAGSTSNVNFGAGSVDPNVAFTKVGTDGQICFTNSTHGPVHVIIDEMIVADAAAFRAPTAAGSERLADTRVGLGGPIVAASETRCLAAVGAAPGEFVGVNVLPVSATTPGFGTIHPSGVPAGSSSTANFGPGTFDPNFAFTQVGADGRICFTNSEHGPVDLVLDELIVGAATAMTRPTPGANSERPVDTRTGIGGNRLDPNGRVCFTVPGSNPGDFGGVNILPLFAAGPGYGTLHSSADLPGTTSNVNYDTGTFDPNFAIAQFGVDNQLCFTNGPISATDVIVDSQIIASATVFSEPTANGSVRLVDTRIART